MKDLLKPLRAIDRPTLVGFLGGILLCCVYLYPGNHAFFTRHFGQLAPPGPFAEWAAHGYQFGAAFLLLFLVPLLWARFGAGLRPADVGLSFGDWRLGFKIVAIGVLVLAGPLYLNGGQADFQAEYPLAKVASRSVALFVLWEICYLIYYLAWEFFFRGFWQLGLSRGALGVAGALALQTAVSTIMHIGKPAGETFSAIVGGLAFGLIALRTRSILYVLLLHWYLGIATDLFCALRARG
ncbi:MAG: CPBP family intramembrane metalloprotease [Deltaproteobacteria bacterium]|nr:CPBP family intramembrane metalloprotease [Deltaproteobacteria bacterium]